MTQSGDRAGAVLIDVQGLQALFDELAAAGYQVLAPTVRDDAIVYDQVAGLDDLPRGWTDEQQAGGYRLRPREDGAYFGFAVGPHSWKRFLHPPVELLWQATRHDGRLRIHEEDAADVRYAFVGVRACELRAIAIQDRVFAHGDHVDRGYARRRRDAFMVAVNCMQAGGTCFCVSMGAGPAVDTGFDLALTELIDADRHEFLVDSGSRQGAAVLGRLPYRLATAEDVAAARAVMAQTARNMGRALDTSDVKQLLQNNPRHPRWDEVAERCLSCGNCTMVCPTCFCTTVYDHTTLAGDEAQRVRRWDSCFTLDHSYIHGGSVRKHTASRYRQWLTHKLASWIDQFGTSGCVGCGRCITWCPVGIDITQEVAAIRATAGVQAEKVNGGHGENHSG